jgi:hypothetical protein
MTFHRTTLNKMSSAKQGRTQELSIMEGQLGLGRGLVEWSTFKDSTLRVFN